MNKHFFLLFILVLFASVVSGATMKWNVQLPMGKHVKSTITVMNRCNAPHFFKLSYQGAAFLQFISNTQVAVFPGGSEQVQISIDTTQLPAGRYQGEVLIRCLDCGEEPTCHQDRDKVVVILTVTADVKECMDVTHEVGRTPESKQKLSTKESEDCNKILAEISRKAEKFKSSLSFPWWSILAKITRVAKALGNAKTDCSQIMLELEYLDQRREKLKKYIKKEKEKTARINAFYEKCAREGWRDANIYLRVIEWRNKHCAKKLAPFEKRLDAMNKKIAQLKKNLPLEQEKKLKVEQTLNDLMANFEAMLSKIMQTKDQWADTLVVNLRCSPCSKLKEAALKLDLPIRDYEKILLQLQAELARAQIELESAKNDLAAAKSAHDACIYEVKSIGKEKNYLMKEYLSMVPKNNRCVSHERHPSRGHYFPCGVNLFPENKDAYVWFRWRDSQCLKIVHKIFSKGYKLKHKYRNFEEKEKEINKKCLEKKQRLDIARAAVDGANARVDAIQMFIDTLQHSGLEENAYQWKEKLLSANRRCLLLLDKEINNIERLRRDRNKVERGCLEALYRFKKTYKNVDKVMEELKKLYDKFPSRKMKCLLNEFKTLKKEGLDKNKTTASSILGSDKPLPYNLDGLKKTANRLKKKIKKIRKAREDIVKNQNSVVERMVRLRQKARKLAFKEKRRREKYNNYLRQLKMWRLCMEKKKAAIADLEEMLRSENRAHMDILVKLKNTLDKSISSLNDLESKAQVVGKVGPLPNIDEKIGSLKEEIEKIATIVSIIDALFNSDRLTPEERTSALADLLKSSGQFIPELPGISEMIMFYSDALDAIIKALNRISDALVKAWMDSSLPEDEMLKYAPSGIHNKLERALKIRNLMRIIKRHCAVPSIPKMNQFTDH